MIRVTAAPLHFPEHEIKISQCKGHDFYAIDIGPAPDYLGASLSIHFTRAQLENMRDQLLALFPLPAPGHPLNRLDTLCAAREGGVIG